MKRTLIIGAAVSALLLAGAGVGLAADVPVLTVDPTAACGRVTLTAEVHQDFNPNGYDTYELAVFAGPNAGNAASDALGQFVVTAEKPVTKTFTLPEDAYAGDGFVSWSTISGPNPEFYVRGAVAVVTDCAPPVVPTTPPTSPPPAPSTATPTPMPGTDAKPEPKAPVKPSAPGYSQVQAVPVGGVSTGA